MIADVPVMLTIVMAGEIVEQVTLLQEEMVGQSGETGTVGIGPLIGRIGESGDTTWSASSPSASAASTWSSWRTWWTNGGWDGQDWSGWEAWSGGARERSVPNTHSSGAGEELARGFYRLGRWVDRARTPEEQRFHDGGQGQQRQSRRQERVRQWKAGAFVPAWKRDMENTAARMHGQSDIDREALRRLLNAEEPRTMSTIREGDDDGGGAPTSGAMPGLTHENRDEISEDRTSCSLSSVGPDDMAAELGLEGVVPEPGVVPPHEPRSEVSPGDASELPVPRPDRGEPWQPDGEPCVLPVQPRDRDDPVYLTAMLLWRLLVVPGSLGMVLTVNPVQPNLVVMTLRYLHNLVTAATLLSVMGNLLCELHGGPGNNGMIGRPGNTSMAMKGTMST